MASSLVDFHHGTLSPTRDTGPASIPTAGELGLSARLKFDTGISVWSFVKEGLVLCMTESVCIFSLNRHSESKI